jgi:PAS domain S-box-containing protein
MADTDKSPYFHEVFDQMFEGVQIVDFDLRYLYVNPVTAAQGRRKASELLGRTMAEMYPGFEKTEAYALIERCAKDRKGQRFVNHFEYPDGSKAWFDLMISPVPMGVLVISVDISERMAMQEALRRSNRELEAFASVAAHDLQEPLR